MTALRGRTVFALLLACIGTLVWLSAGLWWIAVPPLAFGAWGYWWSRRRGDTTQDALTLGCLYMASLSGLQLVFFLLTWAY